MKKVELKPVWKEINVDSETPVSAFLKLKRIGAKFLLESVEKGERLGRYSFIGMKPFRTLKIQNKHLIVDNEKIYFTPDNLIQKLREIIFEFKTSSEPGFPPFVGGWVGYISYDVIKFFESLPSHIKYSESFPEGILCLVRNILVFDHIKHRAKVITLKTQEETDFEALKRINHIIKNLNISLSIKIDEIKTKEIPSLSFDKVRFKKNVEIAKEYIRAGDIFQVVLSERISGETRSHPFQIYRSLRGINPSPYMFYLDFDDFQLIGSSPETLVKLNDGTAYVHPIAGTRPRGKNIDEEKEFEKELFGSEKEIAEHVMLVDLARNDLGKVCLPHSIKVNEKMHLEKYSHVMHIVSQVTGKLAPQYDALDLFKATFPAGTVTGAPKIRAMEIIEELEKVKRGPYAGAVGYFALNGNMDMCIAIRMIIYKKRTYYIQAGAGIVADSDPEREYREILNKMQGVYQAIKYAEEVGR